MAITIRPMTRADVEPATVVVLRGGWGDRRTFFRFAIDHPECRPFVAEADGAIVGTAVGTANGPAGWVGGVFVVEALRRRGIGGALTDAVVAALESAGCRTLVLVATSAGRPIYERLGFRVETEYVMLGARAGIRPGRLESFRVGDLGEMTALDAAATGEDRAHLIRAFAAPDSARVLRRDGSVRGFVVRAPWGGGATIAADPEDGIAILEARRGTTAPDGQVRAGVPVENRSAITRLEALGWEEGWRAPRFIRGPALPWRPELIFGQFNFAMG